MSDSWNGPHHYGEPPAYGEPATPAPFSGPAYYGAPQQPPATAVQPYSPGPAPQYPVMAPQYPAVQPYRTAAFPMVSAGGRLGALLLDVLLAVVTLWIGWFIWAMFTWGDGQTPAKKLLGHVVADAVTGQAFGWGRMALREIGIKGLLGWLLNVVSIGIYFWVDSLMVLGDRQRTLHDRMANSIVRHG